MNLVYSQQQIVVVLGMHRSGTSAITRGLMVLGVELGERLMPPAAGNNDKGFWEDIDIVEMNSDMLKVCGRDWHSMEPLLASDVDKLCDQGFMARAVALLRSKLVGHVRFGFKDPRTVKLLPFWSRVFKEMGLEARYVLALRNPLSVVMSLQRRDKFDVEKSYILWVDNVLTSFVNVGHEKVVVVDYDYLMQQPDQELHRISSWMGTELNVDALTQYREEFLDKALCHSHFTLEDVLADAAAPKLVKEVYGFLVEVLAGLKSLGDIAISGRLEQWQNEFARMRPALHLADKQYSRIIQDSHQIRLLERAVLDRDQEIAARDQEIAARDQEIAARDQEIAARDQEIAARDQEIAARDQRVAHFEGQLLMADQLASQQSLHIQNLAESLAAIRNSTSWKVTAPLRYISTSVQRLIRFFRFLFATVNRSGGVLRFLHKLWSIYRLEGGQGILRRLPSNKPPKLSASHGVSRVHDVIGGDCCDVCPTGGIAVIVHAYYPDLFDSLAEALANIPWAFDLYVSVTNDEARQVIKKIVARLERVEVVEIQVVPNRGRDIAPLLVTYAHAVRSHRYVLHVHTKKSLYSGCERTEWRDHLISGLLGSERRIRQIFSLFECHPKLGIVYPETIEELPYWAHTWLKNRRLALGLADRLGIDIAHKNYIDAPMGSMFWARGDALRPLLELRFAYDDFPVEPIAADGTLAHTIERFFVLSALHAGYDFRAMSDAENGSTLFVMPGYKNIASYYAESASSRIIRQAAGAVEIISFDIFDTLLVRPWFLPDNLFSFLEEIVAKRFGIANFASLRKQAEQIARQRGVAPDVNISHIYRVLGELICNDSDAKSIMALEYEAELATLQPREEVCDVARKLAGQGKRLVLVSDMYLEKSFFESLIKQHHLDFFSEIYLSNDIGVRKDTGALWAILPESEGVSKIHWLHVGDNEHSDVQQPLDAGFMPSVHVMRAADQFQLFNENAATWMAPDVWQEGLLLGLLSNHIFLPGRAKVPVGIDSDNLAIDIRSPEDFGYLVIGPALTVFMSWLMASARADGIELLLYASREGHLLQQAHNRVTKRLSLFEMALPEGVYFLCSRASAGQISLHDRASIGEVLRGHFKGSLAELLRSRYCVDDVTPFVQRLGEGEVRRCGSLPEDFGHFQRQLDDCLDILISQAGVARGHYQRYVSALTAGRRSAIVDIGYAATIQSRLKGCVPGLAGGYYFVTTDKADRVKTEQHFVKGCFADSISHLSLDLPLYRYSLLFEAVMTAPHGQFVGFDAKNEPKYKSPGVAQQQFNKIAEMHAGALSFLEDVLNVTGEHFLCLGRHFLASQLPIQQVMGRRWCLDFDLTPFRVEDDFSGNGEISIFDFYDRK